MIDYITLLPYNVVIKFLRRKRIRQFRRVIEVPIIYYVAKYGVEKGDDEKLD